MSDELKEEGLGLFRRGLHDEALEKFEMAAASYAEAGDKAERGEVLNNIGVIHRVRREWQAAIDAFDEAAAIFSEIGDENRRAQVLGNLGDLYAYQGERKEAARHYSDAAELMAQTGDRARQAELLRALSLLRLRQRRVMEAMMLMEQSLSVRPRLNPLQRLFRGLIRFAMRLMGGT
ncbi:MAG: tetratricopeptide repeat protein [Candidatus Promineifilaceae bacterium]|nr:tetratricopeptide repeat protein [Candidatus Promineifilaceae bacterium]